MFNINLTKLQAIGGIEFVESNQNEVVRNIKY